VELEPGLAADKKKEVPVVDISNFAALCQPIHKGRTSHTIALKPCKPDPTHATYFERHLPMRTLLEAHDKTSTTIVIVLRLPRPRCPRVGKYLHGVTQSSTSFTFRPRPVDLHQLRPEPKVAELTLIKCT